MFGMKRLSATITIALRIFFLTLGCFAGNSRLIAADPNWPVIRRVPVLSNFYNTTDIQNAADGSGRLFLVQVDGIIRILKNETLVETPFLDINTRVAHEIEQGLLGLAFPPNFGVKRCFYVCYTRTSDGAIVLSRFGLSAHPDVADSDSEEVLLVISKSEANNETNHNGGQIVFGPDGLLYLAVGDGGGHGDANRLSQNLTTLLGKLLRIDVENAPSGQSYAIPPSNPFASIPANRGEILCWGLRNPWRFSFDPLTGDLYLSDVGESQREEVNFISAANINNGTNLGWSVKEGTLDFAVQEGITGTLQPPAFEYDRSLGDSIIGGHVYRGANPRLQGFYLFSDFGSGRIWAMQSPASGGEATVLLDTANAISTFGRDESGELYFADFFAGGIYRIEALDTLPAPLILPFGGTYTNSVSLSLSVEALGAVIRYTTDGTVPNETSAIYNPGDPIQLSNPTTIKAIAYRSDLNPSVLAQADYQLRPSAVQFVAPDGVLRDYTTVRLTVTTPGAEIRYTLDGSAPTLGSPLYSDQTPILLTQTTTIRTIALKTGWQPSQEAQRRFYLEVLPAALFTPWSDLYEPVALQSLTSNAVIHYTTDGSTPTLQSPVWTGSLDVLAGTTIKTLAAKGQMTVAYSTLKVTRISSQKATFFKVGTAPSSAMDVVRIDDNTLVVLGGYEIWKVANGISTQIHQGGFAQSFQAGTMTSDAKIAIADAGTQDVIQFQPPAYTTNIRWEANPVAGWDLISEGTGGFLLAGGLSNKIHRITASFAVTTVAGSGAAGSQDGPVTQATFNRPSGVARDESGHIFVAELTGRRIRKIGTDNQVTTLAGTGESGWLDGAGSAAQFEAPRALVRDRIGNLYVSDRLNTFGQIRKIHPDGKVTTLKGPVLNASDGAVIFSENLGQIGPRGLDVDQNGVLYVVDWTRGYLYKVIQDDWDNDGIPDSIETAIGAPYVVGVDDRVADRDADLFSNSAEWIAGTNPWDPGQNPVSSTVSKLNADTLSLSFVCQPGATYQLEFSDDLTIWKPMGAPFIAQLRSFTTQDRTSSLTPRRFYRLIED